MKYFYTIETATSQINSRQFSDRTICAAMGVKCMNAMEACAIDLKYDGPDISPNLVIHTIGKPKQAEFLVYMIDIENGTEDYIQSVFYDAECDAAYVHAHESECYIEPIRIEAVN